MENRLNMSLDDLVNINKSSSGLRGGAGGGGRARSVRAGLLFGDNPTGPQIGPAPYSMPMSKAPDTFWQHDMYGNQDGGASSIETGTKLYISNLDYGVSNDDFKELFSEVGNLK